MHDVELLTFAARHPGALSGYVLSMVHQTLSHGSVRRTSDLRKASVIQWAVQHSGLTDMLDQREVQTRSAVMYLINSPGLATAMYVLSQRILSADDIELVTTGTNMAGGMLKLTTCLLCDMSYVKGCRV